MSLPLTNQRRAAPVSLSLALILMSLFSLVTLDYLKYSLARYASTQSSMLEIVRFSLTNLRAWDYLLLVGVIGSGLVVLWLEFRHQAMTKLLTEVPDQAWRLLAVAVTFWIIHAYFVPGVLLAGDASCHISRTAHFGEGLRQGKLLFWNNFFYLGSPMMQFTGPLYFWVAAVIDAFLQDAMLSTKLLLAALHALSLVCFYRLLRQFEIERLAAGIGSFIYGCSFIHQLLIHWRGTYPQAITFVLFPLTLELSLRVIRDPIILSARTAALALAFAGLIINHQAVAPVALLFGGMLLLLMLAQSANWKRALPPLIAAGAAGSLVCLFAIIPILMERRWVMMYEQADPLNFIVPPLRYFKYLFLWSITVVDARQGNEGYVGLTTLALTVAVLAAAIRGRFSRELRGLTFVAFAALLLSFTVRGEHVRGSVFTLFFFAVLASLGVQYLRSFVRPALFTLVALLVFLDVGPAAIQPHARTDKAFWQPAGEELKINGASQRILIGEKGQGNLKIHVGPGEVPWLNLPVQQLIGAHNLTAPLAHNYVAVTIKMAERDLQNHGKLQPVTEQMLAMYNTALLLYLDSDHLGWPDSVTSAQTEGSLGRVVRVPHPAPLLFSRSLMPLAPAQMIEKPLLWDEDFTKKRPLPFAVEDFIKSVLPVMKINTQARSAAVIPVRAETDNPPVTNRADEVAPDWKGKLLDYRVTVDDVVLKIDSPETGYAQLSQAWYPFLRVEHDGKQITPWRSTFNLLVVPVHAGVNEYRLIPTRTPIRTYLGWVSFLAVLALTAVCVFARKR